MDAKWLEILKASGWHCFAVFAGCSVLILLTKNNVITNVSDDWLIAFYALGIICFFLFLASLLKYLSSFFDIEKRIATFLNNRQTQKNVQNYIPNMTEKERKIISYLIERNQKTFDCDIDGGYASSLMSLGIVQIIARPNQRISYDRVPFGVPDVVWDILRKNKDKFEGAYRAGDPDPWRIPWQLK